MKGRHPQRPSDPMRSSGHKAAGPVEPGPAGRRGHHQTTPEEGMRSPWGTRGSTFEGGHQATIRIVAAGGRESLGGEKWCTHTGAKAADTPSRVRRGGRVVFRPQWKIISHSLGGKLTLQRGWLFQCHSERQTRRRGVIDSHTLEGNLIRAQKTWDESRTT